MQHARRLLLVTASVFCLYSTARAAQFYWDINGATAGAGGTAPSGTWDGTNTFWNTASDGTGATSAWNNLASPFDIAVFAAGGNATLPYTVTVAGTQNISGLQFEEGTVTLTGGTLQLATTGGTISVASNLTATVSSVLSGSATSTLTKDGAGTLVLTGANTYAGQTIINAGVLSISQDANLGAAPGAPVVDSITFGGGTLQITGTLNPTINANRGITINAGLTGTLQVVSAANTVTYGGLITGAAGTTFKKTGAGILDLTANNSASLLGVLQVDGGTLRLTGSGAAAGTTSVILGNRGTLRLDNSVTNLGDRIGGTFISNGGTLEFVGNAAATTESIGALTLNAGALTINSTPGAGGNIITIASITRNAGGTLYVNGTGLGTATNQVVLTTAPALTNTILPWAVVNDGTVVRFATHGGNGTTLTAQTAGYVAAEASWTAATVNAMPTASALVTGTRTVYTLTLNNGIDLTAPAADRSFNVGSGGVGAILQTGGTSSVLASGTNGINFLFGTNEALFHIIGTLTLNRGSDNTNLTGTGGFTKTGAGTLILNGVSSITGTNGFNLNEGVLEIRAAASLIGTATQVMNMNGATLRLSNDTGTTYNGTMVVNADTTIQVDRVTAAATATTHTIGGTGGGGLTLAANRTLSVVSNDITAGTAYGLTFSGVTTLLGNATIDVANNGAGTGTLSVASFTGGFSLRKTGAGDLAVTSVTAGYTGTVEVAEGRIGWNNASGTVNDNTLVIGAGGIFKNGAGTTVLGGNNTFTGGITLISGILGFNTVSDNGGPASNLGQGTDGITLSGGTLSFVGSTNQSTNRAISLTTASTLNASGTSGATITYTGAINAAGNTLTLTGTGTGNITGGITMTGAAADLAINSGTWNFSGTPLVMTDDFINTGATVVVNLNATGIVTWGASPSTSPNFYLRAGATANLGANEAITFTSTGILLIGDASGTAAVNTLNMGTFNQTVNRMDLGAVADIYAGNINGTGTLTVTNATAGSGINLFRGEINANLAGAGAIVKQGAGTVILRGDNSGLGTTTARVDAGILLLDYTVSNTSKLSATAALDMRGSVLRLEGSTAADTVQSVASFTLASGGANRIELVNGTGRSLTLNLGALTRAAGAGTVRINMPASGGVTTTTANLATGILGGYLTIADGTGTYFAQNDGSGNIIALTSTVKNDVSTWATGDHITNNAAFFGTTSCLSINSLRFDAAAASTITIGNGEVLNIASGGILMTSNVTGGPALITGGYLASGIGDLIFTQDSATQSLTVASSITSNTIITKSGVGTLILSGNNDYTGVTNIFAGTLIASGGNAIGDTSAVTLADDQASTFQITSNETIGRLSGGGSGAGLIVGTIAVGTNTLTINQTGGSANLSYAGIFTGSGAIVKNGSGSNTNLSLSGASGAGYTGTVTVNGGLLFLTGLGSMNATAITVNKGASFMIDNNGGTRTGTRLPDNATITLNSADGAWSGETRPSGLAIRTDQGATTNETVGVLQVNSGANYTRLEGTATNAVAAIITDNIVRSNFATLDVRGTNMTATSGARAKLRIGTAANQTSFISSMVGGGGAAGSKNISIVPWAIAEEFTSGIGDTNMGNSLATYVSGEGFRALNLTTEYNTYAASIVATENIREVLTADLTGLASKAINALVIHNNNTAASTINVLGVGAGGSLTVTSGAMLFTLNTAATASSAHQIVLGGFNAGIALGTGIEYVFHVVNPSSVATTPTLTVTINSPLTSTAHITKSGRGTLILTGNNTAGGGATTTTINEGVLDIADLDNIGGNTGGLVFAGGTLRLAATYSGDDLSQRTISFLQGGATLDMGSNNLTFANSYGGSGTGGFTKLGTGTLTLNGTGAYTGPTTISAGTIVLGINQGIGTGDLTLAAGTVLNMGTFNATVGNVTMANAAGTSITGTGTLTASGNFIANQGTIGVQLAGTMNFIKQTASQTVVLSSGNSSYTGFTHVQNGTLNIGVLADAGVNSSVGAATGDNSAIRLGNLTTSGTLLYTGDGDSTNRQIWLVGTTGGGVIDNDGTGALTLSGGVEVMQPGTKTLTLQGTAGTVIDPNRITGLIDQCTGLLNVTKAEAGVWLLSGANIYSGTTTVTAGTLIAGNNLAFGTSTLTLNAGTVQGDGTARTLANTVVLAASSTIGGTSDLTFTGGFTQTGGDRTLTVNNTGITNFTGSFALDRGATNGIVTISAGTGAVVNISNLQDGVGTGTGSLTKTGVGTLNVTNPFTLGGNVTVSAGIANFSGNGNTNIAGNLTVNNSTTTLSGVGVTTVAGNLNVGRNVTATSTLNYNTAGGSLVVGSGAANAVDIGVAAGDVDTVANVNFTGLDSFTANVGAFRVGSYVTGATGSATSVTTVTLATNNTITASTGFILGDNFGAGPAVGGPVTLQFGSGTNTVTTPTMTIGGQKGPATGVGAEVTIAAGGTLTLNNGPLPTDTTDLYVGRNNFGTATNAISTLNLTGGTFIANLDELIIGEKTGGSNGSSVATFTLGSGANAVTATSILLGNVAGAANAAIPTTGTLNFGGGTFSVANDLTMATYGAGATGVVRGTLNLTGGTFTVGGNITKTASTSSTGVITVDGASTVLDMTNGTIAASQLALRNGSIVNVAAGGITLDANSTTTGTGNTGDALILRDTTLTAAVTLTGASGGAIHYENTNGGAGGTLNGNLVMGAVGRTFNIEDSAAAVVDFKLNGDLTGTAGFTKTGAGTMSLTGATAQTFTGAVAIQDGRLVLDGGADNRIASTNAVTLGAGTTSGVLQLGGAAGKSDLTLDSISTSGTGTNNAIVGGNATLSTLTLNVAATTNFAGRLGGAGTNENRLNLVKNGTGTLTFATAGNINGAINVTGGVLNGGFGTSGTTITVAAGAGLNFLDGNAISRTLGTGSVLSLGAGSSLGFEIGSAVDQILGGASSTASVTGLVNIDLFAINSISAGTYTLISMGGGGLTSSGGSYAINSAPGGFSFTLNTTDNLVQLIIAAINVPTMYWRGGIDNSWSTLSAGNTNWTTDLAGTTNAQATPAAATDVFFSATNAPLTSGAISTTLDGSFTVKTLTFTANPVGVTSVQIAPGAPATSTLTITPTNPATGIEVQDSASNIHISAGVVLGANQTWSVSNTLASLFISGNISGPFQLTKTGAGLLTFTGTNSYGATLISAGTLQVGNGGTTGTLGTGLVTNNASLVLNYGAGADVTINNTINGSGTLTKSGAGRATLGGANGYTGKTIINGGTLQISSESALGANPGAFTADQLTLDAGTLQTMVTMAIDDANRGISLAGGGGTFEVNTGTTLTLSTALSGPGGLTTSGAGSLKFGTNQTLASSSNNLTIGATNTSAASGTLDLTTASATFGGAFTVQTNSTSANNISIGAGQSLTINGNVTIGSNAGVNTNTVLAVSGAGTFQVTNTAAAGTFTVGGVSTTSGVGNIAMADFSGLSTMNVNLSGGTSVILISPNITTGTTNVSGKESIMKLAANSTLTAATLTVGGGATFNSDNTQLNELQLGSATNVINVNTFNVGTGSRDYGSVTFAGATGTLVINNAAGTGRANFNMGTTGGSTGTVSAVGNTFDVTGHNATLNFNAVNIGTQNRGNNLLSTFSFNQGTLDMNSLTMSTRSANPSTGTIPTTASTMNIGGGTVFIRNGILNLARTSIASGSLLAGTAVTGTINISGGNVSIGNTSGTSITMASAIVGSAATAVINLTGGVTTLTGNIVKGGGAGTTTATVNLNGGTLDMGNNSIGGAVAVDNVVLASGTLMNVAEINNGADFNKTTTGLLILEGLNNYTGITNVNAGILQVGSGSTTGTLGTNASVTIATSSTLRTSRSNTIDLGQAISGQGAVQVSNTSTGITRLTGNNNTYTGGTTVTSGTLLANNTSGSATGTGAVSVTSTGTLGGTGFITTSGLTVANGGILKPGDSTVANGIGTLTITGPSALNATGGSVLDLQITHTNGTTTSAASNLNGDGSLNWGVILGAGSVAGTSDVIDFVGALTVNTTGTTTARFSSVGAGTFEIGMAWDLIDWVSINSTNAANYSYDFTALALELNSLGMSLDTTHFASDGYVAIAGVVPEPGRVLLLVLGLGGVVLRRRRRI